MDHRASRRLELELPCLLRSIAGRTMTLSGMTVNVSRTGALIRCRNGAPGRRWMPEVGDSVRVEIALARNAVARRRAISGQATVVRTATAGDGDSLVAVQFDQLGVGEWKEQPTALTDFFVREMRVS